MLSPVVKLSCKDHSFIFSLINLRLKTVIMYNSCRSNISSNSIVNKSGNINIVSNSSINENVSNSDNDSSIGNSSNSASDIDCSVVSAQQSHQSRGIDHEDRRFNYERRQNHSNNRQPRVEQSQRCRSYIHGKRWCI